MFLMICTDESSTLPPSFKIAPPSFVAIQSSIVSFEIVTFPPRISKPREFFAVDDRTGLTLSLDGQVVVDDKVLRGDRAGGKDDRVITTAAFAAMMAELSETWPVLSRPF